MEKDSVMDANRNVTVKGALGSDPRWEDVKEWEKEYANILTGKPGLTDIAAFKKDTGDSKPIHQRAYNTTTSLVRVLILRLIGCWRRDT